MFCMFLDSGRKIETRVGLAVRINPQFAIWRDLFFTTGQTVFFFVKQLYLMYVKFYLFYLKGLSNQLHLAPLKYSIRHPSYI